MLDSQSAYWLSVIKHYASVRRQQVTNPAYAICYEATCETMGDYYTHVFRLSVYGIHCHSKHILYNRVYLPVEHLAGQSNKTANYICDCFVNNCFDQLIHLLEAASN